MTKIRRADPTETETALRALRFTDTRYGDRMPEHDVTHYLKHTRRSVMQIEEAIRDNWHPEMNGNREQVLAVLLPHVAWLDAHPEVDPAMAEARKLPTSVLRAALKERRGGGA